ncbi:flagellar protein FlaG [Mangrovimicrobium sediminis]|uniref:Flagellar protein FlaG n=1 Tax=Mangrovimicrobium sediminis TaxID=2562682 RepID=A0A4Z0M153_9GAMM|nr:flagellar protein FlaG [Haliea sp. SAOS-164]TGD73154.1 flagellar protein FlaG [Haliea sp. SAOS-164]
MPLEIQNIPGVNPAAVRNNSERFATGDRVEAVLKLASSESVPPAEPELDDLVAPVARINQALKAYGLEFDLSEKSNRVVTRIVDLESGEVIRQIPNEAVLAVAERLDEAVGVLLQETA